MKMKFTHRIAVVVLTVCTSGCIANMPRGKHRSICDAKCDTKCDELHASNVEYGKERPVIDTIGWLTGIPRKVLLWDRRASNHSVSEQTVAEVTDYLEHSQLHGTLVRVNQYAPVKELQRLVKNQEISPGWKYTVGSLKWLNYTFVPGRLFGKDGYNPYTNTISLYSDMPMLGLAEAAYAKDVSSRKLSGTYAAVQELPLVSLWHETLATREVINYVSIHGTSEQIDEARQDLYARYGLEVAGTASGILPDGTGVYAILGAAGGHAVAALDDRQNMQR